MKIQENCGITWVICFQASFLAIQILFFFFILTNSNALKMVEFGLQKEVCFLCDIYIFKIKPCLKSLILLFS